MSKVFTHSPSSGHQGVVVRWQRGGSLLEASWVARARCALRTECRCATRGAARSRVGGRERACISRTMYYLSPQHALTSTRCAALRRAARALELDEVLYNRRRLHPSAQTSVARRRAPPHVALRSEGAYLCAQPRLERGRQPAERNEHRAAHVLGHRNAARGVGQQPPERLVAHLLPNGSTVTIPCDMIALHVHCILHRHQNDGRVCRHPSRRSRRLCRRCLHRLWGRRAPWSHAPAVRADAARALDLASLPLGDPAPDDSPLPIHGTPRAHPTRGLLSASCRRERRLVQGDWRPRRR